MRLRDRHSLTKAFRSTRLFAVAGIQAVQSEDMFCYSRGNTYRRARMAYLLKYLFVMLAVMIPNLGWM